MAGFLEQGGDPLSEQRVVVRDHDPKGLRTIGWRCNVADSHERARRGASDNRESQ
jgi:hypothetical protein